MKKLLLLLFVTSGFISNAQQVYWEEKSTGFSDVSASLAHISYANANVIWAQASDGSGAAATFRKWARSIDGGLTWTNGAIELGSTDLGIGSIQAIDATTAYVAAFPNATTVQGGIWKTTNSGVTWTKQPTASFNTGTDSFTNLVYFWDANTGMAQGDPAGGYFEIYLTSNGGTNWTRVPSGNIPTPLTGEYGYVHNYKAVGNTIWFGTNKGRIFKSTNQGLNWTASQSPIADFGSAAISGNYTFKNQTEGLLISSDFQFFRTTDGAATWTAEFPNGIYRNFDVCYVPGTTNYVVCTGEDPVDGLRGSSYSVDGGANWIDINAIDVDAVDGGGVLEFFDPTHGLASGFTASSTVGGVFKWINNASLATTTFSNDKAITAYPNPTSGSLELNGKNITQVSVYDILGKQISTTNYGTLSNVTLNLASLNNGIYMVKVTNNLGNTSTIKVVKQ